MSVDKKGNVYLTGTSQGAGSYYDYATVKYSPIITNIQENVSLPERCFLGQNYPNPFNPETKIKYKLSKQSNVSLKIYDMLGKEVMTLVNDMKSAGSFEATFSGINLPSGVYFYKLETPEFMDVKRMILIK